MQRAVFIDNILNLVSIVINYGHFTQVIHLINSCLKTALSGLPFESCVIFCKENYFLAFYQTCMCNIAYFSSVGYLVGQVTVCDPGSYCCPLLGTGRPPTQLPSPPWLASAPQRAAQQTTAPSTLLDFQIYLLDYMDGLFKFCHFWDYIDLNFHGHFNWWLKFPRPFWCCGGAAGLAARKGRPVVGWELQGDSHSKFSVGDAHTG